MPETPPALLEMSGSVTREDVARWRDVLSEAIARDGGLRLDLAASGPWDMCGAQLLLSAMLTADREGGVVQVSGMPKVFLDIIERAGLLDRFASAMEP